MLSAGLWHMLHVTDVQLFSRDLVQLRDAAASFLAKAVQVRVVLHAFEAHWVATLSASRPAMQAPPVSYFSISEVYPPKLKTADKREHLTPARVDAYNQAIADSAVLSPDGPFHLIDIHSLTQGAPHSCVQPLHVQPGRHTFVLSIGRPDVAILWVVGVLSEQQFRTAMPPALFPGLNGLSLRRVRPGVHARRSALFQCDIRHGRAGVG